MTFKIRKASASWTEKATPVEINTLEEFVEFFKKAEKDALENGEGSDFNGLLIWRYEPRDEWHITIADDYLE